MRSLAPFLVLALSVAVAAPVVADVPGSIEITCDVARANFRTAAIGQSTVNFRLWSSATGGTQVGPDYVVPMTNLAIAKRYTDKYDSVKPRKAMRINAVIGSDGSPVLLPVDGQAWLEVVVGATTLGCDLAATGDLTARRRLQSVAFSRESDHAETCETCTNARDISARVSNSGATAIPDGLNTKLAFDSVAWDTDTIYDPAHPTRLTAKTSGKYFIFGFVVFEYNPTGFRELSIRPNGTGIVLDSVAVPAVGGTPYPGGTHLSVSTHYQLAAGDFVEMNLVQNSGAPLNVSGTSSYNSFGMVKLP